MEEQDKTLVTAQQVVAAAKGAVTPSDPRVPPIIESVTAAIRAYCGWHVAPQLRQTLILDGTGDDTIHVPSLRVVEVHSLQADGQAIEPDGFDWTSKGLVRLRSGVFPDRFRSVTLDVTHGFERAADVEQVCSQLALIGLSSPMGATREQAGQISVSWAYQDGVSGGLTLTGRDRAVLDHYRLPSLAGGGY